MNIVIIAKPFVRMAAALLTIAIVMAALPVIQVGCPPGNSYYYYRC